MYFIERIFGISPDGGSGAFEALLFLVPVVIIALLIRRRLPGGAWHVRSSFCLVPARTINYLCRAA